MVMPMMQIRSMCMGVGHRLVLVLMTMPNPRRQSVMLMVVMTVIVPMPMGVNLPLVVMKMSVLLVRQQPHGNRHQQSCDPERKTQGLPQADRRSSNPPEGRRRKHNLGAGGTEVGLESLGGRADPDAPAGPGLCPSVREAGLQTRRVKWSGKYLGRAFRCGAALSPLGWREREFGG